MPRRNPKVPLLLVGASVVIVFLVDFYHLRPWIMLLGGMSLALGAVALLPRSGSPARGAIVGRPPSSVAAFQPRTGVRGSIWDARERGADVILHGIGGTGTTQLAAALAREAIRDQFDLVVWVDAGGPGAVVTAYALAARQVGVAGSADGLAGSADGLAGSADGLAADARALLRWLAETDQRWLVVLDGVTDPAHIADWWPAEHSANGWFLVTTTGPVTDPVFSRGTPVEVGVFSPAESFEYLADCRLADDDAADLATELGHLPLALGRAAAYLGAERLTSGDYLNRWIDRRKTVADPATAAVLLAAPERALPALRMAAVLDPAGQPAAIWKHPAVTGYLAGTPDAAFRAVALLHRYGLLEYDRRFGTRAVRVHPDTAHTVRQNTPATLRAAAARAAADAILDLWPPDDADPRHAELVQVLRANAATLARHDGDPLWLPAPHDLLWRAGVSLEQAGLWAAAVDHWRHLADASARLDDPANTTVRANLAGALWAAGERAEAIDILEQVLAVRRKTLGAAHPDTQATEALLSTWRG